ncbi:hypothetical protein CK203_117058 [Vitis vinifera]|uniref:Uncharacterized protein n=1 Tax=Vitis vinifera TaxID=29760 RepID=A0A438CCR8_VITVI|nr:hypothetical protein CK203_117058 [Vitis vinifera]
MAAMFGENTEPFRGLRRPGMGFTQQHDVLCFGRKYQLNSSNNEAHELRTLVDEGYDLLALSTGPTTFPFSETLTHKRST